MDLFDQHPLLVPLDVQGTVYSGFITIKDKDFRLHIELKNKGCLKGAKLRCDWNLKQLLKHHEYIIQQRLEHSSTLVAFLQELKAIAERQWPKDEEEHHRKTPGYYGDLINQLQVIGWDRLVYIDASFRDVHIKCHDAANREHVLKLQLDTNHPDVAPKCIADIPAKFNFIWNSSSTMECVCAQYEKQLAPHQLLWDVLDELDKNTCILEPEKATRRALYRRVALGSNASVHITVDASQPCAFPECTFLGADHVTNPLRENLNKNLDKWDNSGRLLKNLQTVLGISFPSPSNTKKEDLNLACGICYAYRLGADIPEQVCEDVRCAQPFHQSCLYEWLRGLPSSRQSFNVVFGECPYCNKAITVKMPGT